VTARGKSTASAGTKAKPAKKRAQTGSPRARSTAARSESQAQKRHRSSLLRRIRFRPVLPASLKQSADKPRPRDMSKKVRHLHEQSVRVSMSNIQK